MIEPQLSFDRILLVLISSTMRFKNVQRAHSVKLTIPRTLRYRSMLIQILCDIISPAVYDLHLHQPDQISVFG